MLLLMLMIASLASEYHACFSTLCFKEKLSLITKGKDLGTRLNANDWVSKYSQSTNRMILCIIQYLYSEHSNQGRSDQLRFTGLKTKDPSYTSMKSYIFNILYFVVCKIDGHTRYNHDQGFPL